MDKDAGREELAAIRSLMAESQGLLTGSWRHQLVWGLLTTFALFGTWVAIRREDCRCLSTTTRLVLQKIMQRSDGTLHMCCI